MIRGEFERPGPDEEIYFNGLPGRTLAVAPAVAVTTTVCVTVVGAYDHEEGGIRMDAGDRGVGTHSTRPEIGGHAGASAGSGTAALDWLGTELARLELVEPAVIARDGLDGIHAQSKGKESDEEVFGEHFELNGTILDRLLQGMSEKNVSAGCLGTIKVLQRLRSGKKTTPVSGDRRLMAH